VDKKSIEQALDPAGLGEVEKLAECLTPRDIGRFLRVSDATVAVILASGELRSFRARGSRRVLRQDLMAWIEQSRGVRR
jgi:excisionase family DNA binding protein